MKRTFASITLIIVTLALYLLTACTEMPLAVPQTALTPTVAPPASSPTATSQSAPSSAASHAVPAPDGRWIALISDSSADFTLTGPDGQTETVSLSGSSLGAATWSPDSQKLLLVQPHWLMTDPQTGVQSEGPIQIWQVSVADDVVSEPTLVYQLDPYDPGMGPQQIQFGPWSPDSRLKSPSSKLHPRPIPTTLPLELGLVDQLYGQTLAVARQGDLLYLGVGPCLQVFAINDLADFEPLGQCAPLPGLINDIVLVDDLAYIAAGDAGLQILDLATPIDPQPLAGLVKTLYSSSVAYSRIC